MLLPSQMLNQPFACSCGRTHFVPIEQIVVTERAIDEICAYLQAKGVQRVLVVGDNNTKQAGGAALYQRLTDVGMSCGPQWFEHTGDLHPDEDAVAAVRTAIGECKPHMLIAVGSGTINDVTRFTSFEARLPYIVFATAPSMDGYASSVAAMQFAGVKTTFESHAPMAIFADDRILAAAPWPLIQAGFGDLLGKVTSLLDWKLSSYLYGEYFCQESYELVLKPLRDCLDHAQQLRDRDVERVRELFSGLIQAGIAMAMVGNSRPCSGSEHHCSHYWDLLAYQGVRRYASHGLQVGYAVHWTSRFYQFMSNMQTMTQPLPLRLSAEWKEYVHAFYREGATEILSAQKAKRTWLAERETTAKFGDISGLKQSLEPELSMINTAHRALDIMGIPFKRNFLELNSTMLRDTFMHAHELRSRYTIFDFLRGQGSLEQAVDWVFNECMES
ncbi:sn-glycerol-1-phosphate dehydrogenase [Alicyclobacillus acidiphilus]|uniref:sn-glycerol-1-phosphate dehydrogenase n=1 Tax=Alicyclobacillus acidiphilus TaxID=182455 RepID=UPI00083579A9|nr:sn-glycerol-1-phosphate dehydrogenase [Alicyclobacillus acidiphilus]